jgi:fibronectin type 3 domain-containing protein
VATATDAQAAEAAVAGNEHEVGSWGPLVDWPVVGVHAALLANGKVLVYDSVGDRATETFPGDHTFTRATVWDPQSETHTPVTVSTGYNVFCSGLAHLSDGTLFLAGGNKDEGLSGIVQTHMFNHQTNTWSVGPNMAQGRWYPTVTPLSNGEMLITDGGPVVPEVRTTGGTLRWLSTAALDLPLYPWLHAAPDGRAFYVGPDQTMRALNTSGTGAWQSLGQRDGIYRDYGSHALFDVGKILVAGGSGSTADARVVDINGATPQVSATTPMARGRRQHNLTVLADGSVLATGGNSSGAGLIDLNNGVYTAERWNPATGTWKTMAPEQATRQYHSTALLLADGRVLSSGGGICGTCDDVGYLAKNAQVFTPPYLYKADGSGELAPRPEITGAPATADHGTTFQIDTPNAPAIRKVALVRLGAVTHSVNMEQRYVPLSFTAGTGSLTASAPANVNIAPPGVYMLFVIDANGVPSVAKMVTMGGAEPPPPPPPPNSGLVGAWGFSEGGGTTTADASGKGNGGTITGATWTTQGRYGNALSFNGTNSIVRVASSASLNLTTGMTLSAWVRPTAAQSGWRTILHRQTDAYLLHASNGDPLHPAGGGTFGGSPDFVGGPTAIPVNTWTHVAVTYDLAAMRLYVNGTQAATKAATGAIETNANPLWIGGNAPYGEYFQGLIDEARVYNRALTPAEIQTDMSTAVTPSPPDSSPPSAPANLNAVAAGSSEIDLSWTASTDNVGVTGYRVERCQGTGCTNFVQVATPTATTLDDSDLTPSTTYRYRVRAADSAGNLSLYSAIAGATTPAAPDTTPPSAPTGLGATAVSTSQIDLSWTASTDNVGVTGYRVERCLGTSCTNFTQIGTPTTTSFSSTGLAANTTYRFRARAVDGADNLSAYSTIATATTPPPPDTTPPTAPADLTATAVGTGQVNLGWTASTDDVGVTGYRVERCSGQGCSTFAEVAAPTTTTYGDTGLSPSTTYRYRVRAVDAAAKLSGYSNVADATTEAPPTPTGLIGAWAFGEGTGTSTADASGNGNVGTTVGATWSTKGRHGNALSFNGSNSVVRVASSASLNLTTAMTLSAWIRPTGSQSGWRTILRRQADAYFLAASSDSRRRPAGGGTLGGGLTYVGSSTDTPANSWTHVALTYDGAALRLYVNGTQASSRAATGTIQASTNPLWIGGNTPYGQYFQGLIDEARIYSRALSPTEIQTDMNTPIAWSGLPSLLF